MEKGKHPENISKPKQYVKSTKYALKGYEKHKVVDDMIAKAENVMAENQFKD